jgi:hypothetical protein
LTGSRTWSSGPLDLKFADVDDGTRHEQLEVLFAFKVERVEAVVHASDNNLLIENEHAHWFAFNSVDKFRDHFTVPDKVNSAISAGNIDSIINIQLTSCLDEAGNRF